ncbi:MAG: ATP-dependent zinc metalloprotease FtsH [bacterium]|nr:ATP-dependent zinc metalloprotease FtsH [bacterium]
MNKGLNLTLWLIFLILVLPYMIKTLQTPIPPQPNKITYSEFLEYVQKNKVEKVKIVEQDIKGILKGGKGEKVFVTYIPHEDPDLIKFLIEHKVSFEGDRPTEAKWWMTLLWYLGSPLIFFFFLWLLFYRQMKGPGGIGRIVTFGQSRAKFSHKEKSPITFKDVAGVDEAKEELQEIIEFLMGPKKFQKLGAKIPKGVLLVGLPGAGKTLLAKAVAGEAQVPFFSISGSDFVEMFVGVGASRVRDLFAQAKRQVASTGKGCIIFIDEIDAVGRQRGAGFGGGHDEREQTLNQLLVEMDGFGTGEGVMLIAATNRPDVLDPALLRPGRFDRHITVDIPDLLGREAILKVHMKNIKVLKGTDVKLIAKRTSMFVGSDLANLVNEAALLAARRKKKRVTMKEFEDAIERVIAGPEKKSKVTSEREKRIKAYHEAGHTLIAKLLPNSDPVHKVSIIPRGIAGGYTLQLPVEDKHLYTRTELLDKMVIALGGMRAELIEFNDMTTGAQKDIEWITDIVHKMVCEYGMSDSMGPIAYGKRDQEIFLGRDFMKEKNYSEEIASKIDKEIYNIIDLCNRRAEELLKENKDKLDALANALIEKETLESQEIDAILGIEDEGKLEIGN